MDYLLIFYYILKNKLQKERNIHLTGEIKRNPSRKIKIYKT